VKYVFMSSFQTKNAESVAANRFVNSEDLPPHASLSGLSEMSRSPMLLQLQSGIDPERAIEMREGLRPWVVNRMQISRGFEADPLRGRQSLTRKMDAIVPRVPTGFREFKPFGRPARHHPSVVLFLQLGDPVPVHGLAVDDHLEHHGRKHFRSAQRKGRSRTLT
jgi:hypothetical protein